MPKSGFVAENFLLKGAAFLTGVFLKVLSSSAANRTWSAFVPLIIEIPRLFCEQAIFHVCTISVQISPKLQTMHAVDFAQREAAAASAELLLVRRMEAKISDR